MLPMACTASARLKLTDDRTVSVPSPPVSFDHVAGIVDHIGVVTGATKHLVGTSAAIQRVGTCQDPSQNVRAAIANKDVIEVVARRAKRRAASQRQVLHEGQRGKREADRRLDRIGALAIELGHHVAHIVDHIGVVARATKHLVGTGPAIEGVVAAQAGDHVARWFPSEYR